MQKLQDEIRQRVADWQKRLGLDGWRIEVEFGSSDDSYASCTAKPRYLEATLHFDVAQIAAKRCDLDELVAHELLHCYIERLAELANRLAGDSEPMRWVVREIEEELATVLGWAFARMVR